MGAFWVFFSSADFEPSSKWVDERPYVNSRWLYTCGVPTSPEPVKFAPIFDLSSLVSKWGNISQSSAHSQDFVHWHDFGTWEDPRTMWPSELYDIRGVFDGSILKDGWEGYPTIIYCSTFTSPFGSGSEPPESQGAETQSIAYTTDDGASWIKLSTRSEGNPIICSCILIRTVYVSASHKGPSGQVA
jgi:hypothetical protein